MVATFRTRPLTRSWRPLLTAGTPSTRASPFHSHATPPAVTVTSTTTKHILSTTRARPTQTCPHTQHHHHHHHHHQQLRYFSSSPTTQVKSTRAQVAKQAEQRAIAARRGVGVQQVAQSPDSRNLDQIRNIQILSPMTIVPLPLSRMPRNVFDFLRYQWLRCRHHLSDFGQMLLVQHTTRAKFFGPARMKLARKDLVPTAKALHREMSVALAQGDVEALQKICCPGMLRRLAAQIENRSSSSSSSLSSSSLGAARGGGGGAAAAARGKGLGPVAIRYTWELVKYNGSSFWPRIMDNKWTNLQMHADTTTSFRQVVVGIKSRQRLTKYEQARRGGVWEMVEGSEKEKDVTEYLVMRQITNIEAFTAGEWRIFGTLQETTLEELEQEIKDAKDAVDAM